MPAASHLWYIRYPDGRILRAESVAVIRQQLTAGRLPPGIFLRRSGEDEWRGVDRFTEFADLGGAASAGRASASTASIASRLDPAQLRMPDVRGMLEELLAAVESTLVPGKLYAVVAAGAVTGGLLVAATQAPFALTVDAAGWGWLLVLPAVVVLAWLTGMLTRMSYVELARLQPARWRDGMQGRGLTVRLSLFYLVAGALLGAVIGGLRALPGWLATGATEGETARAVLARVAVPLTVAAEALVWPLALLLLPFAALLVIEEVTFRRGVGQWVRLVRSRFHRLLLAEGLAVVLALLVSTPLLLVLGLLATRDAGDPEQISLVVLTRTFLLGMASMVPVAYLLVANVFIYLKMRYETPGRRQGTA